MKQLTGLLELLWNFLLHLLGFLITLLPLAILHRLFGSQR